VEAGSPPVDSDAFDTMNLRFWCGYLAYSLRALGGLTGRTPSSDFVEHTVLRCAELGATFSVVDMIEASATQNAITRAVSAFFTDVDVLVTPTVSRPPWGLGELDANDASLSAEEWLDKIFTYCPFTALFNATGQPAMSLPLGWHDGLPIGVQLVGRHGAEDMLLRVASQLEEAMPWAQRRPPVHAAS
jgi:amidase